VTPPPGGRSAPRRSTSLLLVSLLGVLTAVLLVVFVLRLSRSSNTKVQLGVDTFDVGKTTDLQRQIARGGPVLFPGLRGPGFDIYVEHIGTDPAHGWLAFRADAPGGCVLGRPRPDRHVLACNGTTFPEDGLGLDQYAATVGSNGHLAVNLQASTGRTPRPS
jgi:hypothetical protein